MSHSVATIAARASGLDADAFHPDCAIALRFYASHTQNGTCRGCSVAIGGRRTVWCSERCSRKFWNAFAREHDWNDARRRALRRDKKKCLKCGSATKLEVNHIVPRLGKGYGLGCHHHLSNLETLCRECHLAVTLAQRRTREPSRRVALRKPPKRADTTNAIASGTKTARRSPGT